jgi:hypothetical protein
VVEALTVFLKGPAFVFCLVFAILGVGRLFFMHVHAIVAALHNARHQEQDRRDLMKIILKKAFVFQQGQFGFRQGPRARVILDTVIVVLLLPNVSHIVLAEKFFGVKQLVAVSWPCTVVLLAILCISISFRLYFLSIRTKRFLGVFNAVSFWSLLFLLCASGYCASIVSSPMVLAYARIFHVLFGDLFILLIPFSRVGYVLILPLANITSRLGAWLLPETSAYFKKLSEKKE